MTRQEAIELLSSDVFKLCMVQLCDPLCEACYEALNMAIEALDQQSKRGKIMSKYIKLADALNDCYEPKYGTWVYNAEAYPFGNPYGHYECDQCGERVPDKTNYCPNCGAKMESDGE